MLSKEMPEAKRVRKIGLQLAYKAGLDKGGGYTSHMKVLTTCCWILGSLRPAAGVPYVYIHQLSTPCLRHPYHGSMLAVVAVDIKSGVVTLTTLTLALSSSFTLVHLIRFDLPHAG